jgi:hypothetical protein
VYLNGSIKLMYLKQSWGSSVSVVTRLRDSGGIIGFSARLQIFLSSKAFSQSLWLVFPVPFSLDTGRLSPLVRRPERLFKHPICRNWEGVDQYLRFRIFLRIARSNNFTYTLLLLTTQNSLFWTCRNFRETRFSVIFQTIFVRPVFQ